MSINGVNNVLTQMRALQARSADLQQPSLDGVADAKKPNGVGFAETLGSAINEVNNTQKAAESMSTAFVQGAKDVELADVMLSLNKADVSFKTLAEVRNRMVSAYQDIMNMPV